MCVEIDKTCRNELLSFFNEISAVPRLSGSEEKISQYLYDLAVRKRWCVEKDNVSNIIIRKNATKGYENKPVVILQGHMDMVCEKEKGIVHDFLSEGISMKQTDNWLQAEGTTLGADNGVAIAYGLEILNSENIQHPPLEIVFTVGEETSMRGAYGLELEKLKGRMLINLDSEEEGIITAGCAGTTHVTYEIPVKYAGQTNKAIYSVTVSGLTGGHSGTDIDKNRANANKILGIVLEKVFSQTEAELVSIDGGTKENVIPKGAEAIVASGNEGKLQEIITKLEAELKNTYKQSDGDLKLGLEKLSSDKNIVYDRHTADTIIKAILDTKNGPIYWDREKDILAVSNNLGVVRTLEDKVVIINNARSSDKKLKETAINNMCSIAKSLGIPVQVKDTSFPWEYAESSRLRDVALKSYRQITGKEAKVVCIHAGVECGYFVKEMKGLDAISIGPTIENVHTTKERLDMKSFYDTYKFLLSILKNI